MGNEDRGAGGAGAVDQKALQDAINAALGPALTAALKPIGDAVTSLAANQKVFADTLAQLPPAPKDGKEGKKKEGEETPATLTAQDVIKLLDERDAKRQSTTQREQFMAEKLKDLPAPYRAQLGSDPAKWADEEQKLRTQYQADFKVAGGTTKVVDGGQGTEGAKKPGGDVDLSKLSASQLIEMGLNQQTAAK